MDIGTTFSILISLSLYIFSGWIFIEVLKFIKTTLLPKMLSGKLQVGEIFSMVGGIAILGIVVMFGPFYVAKGVQTGWNKFIPVMMETANGVVADVEGLIGGRSGVQFTSSGNNYTVQNGNLPENPGQVVLPGNINPLTGQPYNDPNSGGGGGIIPTPIMPNMQENIVVPTPTLAPTATAFDINTWQPGQVVPTPAP